MARLRRYGLTKVQKQIVTECTKFMGDMFIPRAQHRMTIVVKGSDTLLDQEGLYGYCDYIDDDPWDRMFEIKIYSKLGYRAFIETYVHEMIHVKQYTKGEMKFLARTPDVLKWRQARIDTNEYSYWDLPWEEEAHRLERPLTNAFLRTHKHWSAKIYYDDQHKNHSTKNDWVERQANVGRVRP